MASADYQLVQNIGSLLATSLNPVTQKQAEASLKQLEMSPGFVKALMMLVEGNMGGMTVEVHLRMAGSVLFKNFIRNHWPNEADTTFITVEERQFIKGNLVNLMLMVPGNVQAQLSEALVTVATFDFPQEWPDLINSLVGRLSPSDFSLNNAVLRTLHRIFKRYRGEARSDELYTEINFVMAQFGPTLLSLYRTLSQLVETNSSNAQLLPILLESQIICNRIYYSLSSQDLPMFFEDNLGEFMGFFEKHFLYKNPVVVSEDDKAGVLQKLPASVAKIITLYALKYEEDFPQLPQFVQLSWAVLTAITQDPKDDRLAGSSMAFLTTVAKQERHKELFGPVLQLICDKIVLPNMIFREGDLELFEDEPLEFIRRDQEIAVTGDGQHSRRGGAISLARGLMEFYETEVTTILATYLEQYLSSYADSPGSKWREKDVAIQLFSAIAIKGTVAIYGVTRVNDMINIGDFFRQHILPDLQPTNEALHPILKMDAIKFLNAFRNQLGRDALVNAFPLLMHHVASHNHVIHTYAAMAVERILAIKGPTGSLLFSPEDLKQVVEPLCVSLLKLMVGKRTAEKMAENEHLMKALMRVLLLAQRDLIRPILGKLIDPLAELLFQISKNPSNPKFNHFMFETIAVLIKEVGPIPDALGLLESKFMPLLQGILAEDVTDFVPYAFQLLAGLVEVRAPGQLPPFMGELFGIVLQPVLWASSGNVPALVRLIQAGLLRDPSFFASHLQTLLGIYQTLMSGRSNDIYAFALLGTLLQSIPPAQMQPYLQPAFMVILKKLQSAKTTRNASLTLISLSTAILCYSPSTIFSLFEGIQPKMLVGLMKTVLLPVAGKIKEKKDKKLIQVALARFVTGCDAIFGLLSDPEYASLWLAILSTDLSLLANIQPQPIETIPIAYETSTAGVEGDEMISGGAAFSRLQVLLPPPKYPFLDAIDPVSHLATGISQLSKQLAAISSLIENGLDAEHRNILQAILRQQNLSL